MSEPVSWMPRKGNHHDGERQRSSIRDHGVRARALAGHKARGLLRRVGDASAGGLWWMLRAGGRWELGRPDPTLLSSVLMLSVYRTRNVSILERHVASVRRAGGHVRLWCLDGEPADELAAWTVGTGPGDRCVLLNRLYGSGRSDVEGELDVVILDDDVTMTAGSISDLLRLARRAEFDIAQPAHDHESHSVHLVTARHPLSIARETHFVEIGPMALIRDSIREEVFPMPEEFGMGWGLDFRWSRQFRGRRRMGIVDVLAIRHLSPIAVDYAVDHETVERMQGEERLAGRVGRGRAVATWRPWQSRPPWTARR